MVLHLLAKGNNFYLSKYLDTGIPRVREQEESADWKIACKISELHATNAKVQIPRDWLNYAMRRKIQFLKPVNRSPLEINQVDPLLTKANFPASNRRSLHSEFELCACKITHKHDV